MTAHPEGGPERRARITEELARKTGIDDAMIERLVRGFYGRAQHDPLIGPIFAAHVKDWEPHIARMCEFWSSVALMTGRYHGQPMRMHMPLPIDRPHFERWLSIFSEVAREICPPVAAAHFIERAERIAESLQLGIDASRGMPVGGRTISGETARSAPRAATTGTDRPA